MLEKKEEMLADFQKMLDFVDTRVPDPSLPPVIVEESGRKGHYPVTPDKAKTPCIVHFVEWKLMMDWVEETKVVCRKSTTVLPTAKTAGCRPTSQYLERRGRYMS